jgi:hypothetical protein
VGQVQNKEPSTPAMEDLNVKSADLLGNAITGMHATIKASNGTIIKDGFTPVTFAGKEGDTYIVSVDDFRDRKFDHWDNGAKDRERTVILDHDTTITANYDIKSVKDERTIINQLGNLINNDNCDDKVRHDINKAIEKILKDIFSNNRTDSISKLLENTTSECLAHE